LGTLADEIRNQLGPAPELACWPLVSIIVVNRDGAGHLRRLIAALNERTDYPSLELILVDNGSSDDSIEFMRRVEVAFPISIVVNCHNESFSDANNQGAELSRGELLLFLNNDIEPFEPGWLRELVACRQASEAGAVGGMLIYLDEQCGSPTGYAMQTQPVRLRGDSCNLAVDPNTTRRTLFDECFGEDMPAATVIAACLLIERSLFGEVGGFTHGYFYGGEDEDLCLKVLERGLGVRYSGRAILIHHVSATTRKVLGKAGGPLRRANALLLRRHWGARVWRQYHLDRLAGGGLWALAGQQAPGDGLSREAVLALGFCVKADRLPTQHEGRLTELETELDARGHRCLTLRDESIEDPRGLFFDVVVHLRGPARYIPVSGRLNVLWAISHFDSLAAIECGQYDLVVTENGEHATQLSEYGQTSPVLESAAERAVAELIDATLARAEEIGLATQVEPLA